MAKLLTYLVLVVSTHLARCFIFEPNFDIFNNIVLEKGQPLKLNSSSGKIILNNINGTVYSGSLSQLQNVTTLGIYDSYITEIEDEAFCPAHLKALLLNFYSIPNPPKLRKSIFKNCDQLEELHLEFDKDTKDYKIDIDVLENLHNLENFHIRGYSLPKLDKNFLKLQNLTKIAFTSCDIYEVDENTFTELPELEEIVIVQNPNLTTLPKNIFKNNPKLKTLFLDHNNIKSLPWDNLGNLDNLEILNLQSNQISNFDAAQFSKRFPNLERLEIALNPPTCKEKEAFVNELKTKLENVEVSYKFDPGFFDSCEET